jgi:hypothetical protein
MMDIGCELAWCRFLMVLFNGCGGFPHFALAA